MKKIRVKVTVDRIQPGAFLDLFRMLTEAGYDRPQISNGSELNEIVVVIDGRFGQDDGEGYFLETGGVLGLIRGYLAGKGHVIQGHSVERIA